MCSREASNRRICYKQGTDFDFKQIKIDQKTQVEVVDVGVEIKLINCTNQMQVRLHNGNYSVISARELLYPVAVFLSSNSDSPIIFCYFRKTKKAICMVLIFVVVQVSVIDRVSRYK